MDLLDPETRRAARSIDRTRLHDEYTELPALVGSYGELYADALFAEAEADESADLQEALAAEQIRGTNTKVTETYIKQCVSTDPSVQAARKAARDAHHRKNLARQQLDALLVKRDMLVSLGAQVREEMRSLGDSMKG